MHLNSVLKSLADTFSMVSTAVEMVFGLVAVLRKKQRQVLFISGFFGVFFTTFHYSSLFNFEKDSTLGTEISQQISMTFRHSLSAEDEP